MPDPHHPGPSSLIDEQPGYKEHDEIYDQGSSMVHVDQVPQATAGFSHVLEEAGHVAHHESECHEDADHSSECGEYAQHQTPADEELCPGKHRAEQVGKAHWQHVVVLN